MYWYSYSRIQVYLYRNAGRQPESNLKMCGESVEFVALVLAMDAKSPVFEAPGQKRTRKTDERVLGKGHHAEVTLKLAVVRIHEQLVKGELVIKSKKKLPKGMVAKTAKVFGVAKGTIQTILNEAAGGTVSAPEIRGRDPTDPDRFVTP